MNKKVLVTGGAGYVGSQTCKFLKQQGYDPVVFDSLEKGHKQAVLWGDLIVGDLRNYADISSCLQIVKPIGIIHCAAYIDVGESVYNPYKYYKNNVMGTANLLKAMVEHKVNNIVFSSTCSVYGNVKEFPILEDTQREPINPYASSKMAAEQIMKEFDVSNGIKSIIFRYFNVSGADRDGEVGLYNEEKTHLIPVVLDVALGIKPNINIFGGDYNTKDGTALRDYIHVEDLANAHYLGLLYLLDGKGSNDFNLGSENGYTVKEVISSVRRITKHEIPEQIIDRRAGDPEALVANSKKAKDILTWKAQYKDIDKIVESAYKWAVKLHNSR